MSENKNEAPETTVLEEGTYEIIRKRLLNAGDELRSKLNDLNSSRKEVFGSIETTLLSTERVTTNNNCIPRDIVTIGQSFLFGYNVHIGLRTSTNLADVFSIYTYSDKVFHATSLSLINDKAFQRDFDNLYKYYKDTQFSKFAVLGPFLYMVFQIGNTTNDIKVFKWEIKNNKLIYSDDRAENEFRYPNQHQFEWSKTTRDMFRDGIHPHVSIEDQVFVETVGGDLTIKVEDNTDDGKGIYNELVDYADQKLQDAEIYYSIVGNLIFLKVKPYKEEQFRYIIFNKKIQEAKNVDGIEHACVLLPEDHGVIFPKGYYLQTGESKIFDTSLKTMLFEKSVKSPNGEDYLFVFYNQVSGTYVLLSYNLIDQTVATPIICHGYSIMPNGELHYFKAEEEPQKHHAIQIWQTPYLETAIDHSAKNKSFLAKVGNKDIVKGMAECHEVLNLIHKKDAYANLYIDIVSRVTGILDSFYWLNKKDAFNLFDTLHTINTVAGSAIDEFEKVVKIKKSTQEQLEQTEQNTKELLRELKSSRLKNIDEFVKLLAKLRAVRGEVISLKELRYVDLTKVANYEKTLEDENAKLSNNCVQFLLKKEALGFYVDKIEELNSKVDSLSKVVDADNLEKEVLATSKELEMLIEIVGNLKIEDATQTTAIINSISDIYASFNQINANLKRNRKKLFLVEGEAEFNSQLKLISQGIINYLDISDGVDKCEEYLSKLMVQLEELEGKFSEFEEYIEKISDKRNEVYNAFESRKVQLIEKRNKRTAALQASANRILSGVKNRLGDMEDLNQINGYMASDLMVDKLRNIVKNLIELGDTVKADEVQSKLKSTQEEAIRQLKDKTELFDGDNLISFGNHQFSVNNQNIELTIVPRNNSMYYHITGTNFFEEITETEFQQTHDVWKQDLVSENKAVYRSEYLAYQAMQALTSNKEINFSEAVTWTDQERLDFVGQIMAPKYNEGYVKGVHDVDASKILASLINISHSAGNLSYSAPSRIGAIYFWKFSLTQEQRQAYNQEFKSAGIILKAFPNSKAFGYLIGKLETQMNEFAQQQSEFLQGNNAESANYLFKELSTSDKFGISKPASQLKADFLKQLKLDIQEKNYQNSLKSVTDEEQRFRLIRSWLSAFASTKEQVKQAWIDEACLLLLEGDSKYHLVNTELTVTLQGLNGTHGRINNGELIIDLHEFNTRLNRFSLENVEAYQQFTALKKQYIENYKEELKLDELKPRVMNSFVRNQLINKVYLPIIGDNLAKQIGTASANKRTDLMGMLLLISPPGYGKTTLMEYIATRLGVIFLKVNGPAIGHAVTSLDPAEAPNAGARDEIEKLNLGLEMGDNVMIYLDDIQHCNPEFLQKFISLCDAQRKIEGVYKGKSKTYDLRGKKVSVVMAGNPYTESGEKFQIPDMLANRADVYNLGDILGGNEREFEMSYLENSLTSNATLRKLSGKSQSDLHTLIQLAETGNQEGLEFESNHSPEDLNDYVSVLKKLIQVRDVILRVNQLYIQSAAIEEQYREEPPFKLQGSYRNMNKIAEKVAPIMNDKELQTLVMNLYENDSQTLTSSAEANLLKFKNMLGWQSEVELNRWNSLKETFQKNQRLKGFGENNQMGLILGQMEALANGLLGIKEVLAKGKEEKKQRI